MSNFYNEDHIKSQNNFELEKLINQQAKPSEKCINFLLNFSKAAELKKGKNLQVFLIKN